MNKCQFNIFVFVLMAFSSGRGQNCQSAINYADYKFLAGDFVSCITEYQRSLLFAPDSNKAYLYRQLGKCFQGTNDFRRAQEFFLLAETSYKGDSLKLECKFEGLVSFIQNGNFFDAMKELASISDSTNSYFESRKMFYYGICYWCIGQCTEAFPFFLAAIPDHEVLKRQTLMALEKRIVKPGHPYPKIAFILNIIPGMGLVYDGEIKQGVNSFFLCAGLFSTGIVSLKVFQNDLVFLNLLPWIQRYYIGGMVLARDLAEKKRARQRNLIFMNILDLMNPATVQSSVESLTLVLSN